MTTRGKAQRKPLAKLACLQIRTVVEPWPISRPPASHPAPHFDVSGGWKATNAQWRRVSKAMALANACASLASTVPRICLSVQLSCHPTTFGIIVRYLQFTSNRVKPCPVSETVETSPVEQRLEISALQRCKKVPNYLFTSPTARVLPLC
jgi:hypothetical protein